MEEFISETVKISRSAESVFGLLSDLSLFAQSASNFPVKEIEDIQCSPDACSFRFRGIEVGVRIVDREPYRTVKYAGDRNVPFDFFVWIQLKELAPDDTRMRIVLRAKLNFLMKTMFKGKIKEGLNRAASQLADALNRR